MQETRNTRIGALNFGQPAVPCSKARDAIGWSYADQA
jgi:hypothetical protein